MYLLPTTGLFASYLLILGVFKSRSDAAPGGASLRDMATFWHSSEQLSSILRAQSRQA